jgi:glycosyltransferase involved in cell wall biosynthesis
MAWQLVKRLGRAHQLWVLTAAQNREALAAALKEEPLPNVEFVYVDLPGWMGPLLRRQGTLQLYAYLWQWKAYLVARKLHRQVKFDVFHQLSYENDWMASFIGALLAVPYFRGPCGGAHRIPRAFLKEFPLANRLGENLREKGQWLFRHDPFFIMSHRRARAILVGNREAWEALPRSCRQKSPIVSVNGVSPELIALAQPIPGRGRGFQVLSAGRLVRIKGFDLALRAFARFVRQHPDSQFRIAGDGPDRARLQSLTQTLGLGRQVRFEGWMAQPQLFHKMAACDVFLFPSLRDGGGLVVVEAMAAGKPVICLDLGGPGLHVTEQCGIKVTPNSPEQAITDMAAALERLYDDCELRARMGQAGRQRVEQVYGWDRVSERVLEIYRAALAEC